MKFLAHQNVLILGLGASGLAMARWCIRHGASVTVADTRDAPPQLETLNDEVPAAVFVQSAMDQALFDSATFDLVLKSPGLAPSAISGVVNAAEARGTARGNELSLFAQALADLKERWGYEPKVIGITGTNGKTTVTSLTGKLVERAGKSVAVAGNIGPTLLDTLAGLLDQEPPRDEAVTVGETFGESIDAGVAAAGPDEAVPMDLDAAVEAQAGAVVAEIASANVFVETPGDETAVSAAAAIEDQQHATPAESIGATESSGLKEAAEAAEASESEEPVDLAELLPPPPPPKPVFESLPEVWVLELSSFQLDGISNFEPTIATVLNITQDHLDWHETLPAYAAAKARIYGNGVMLLNRDDALVMAQLPPVPPPVRGKKQPGRVYVTFGADAPQRPGDYGIETANGMAWLVRASEADETIKRRRGEEIELYVQRLMPVEALRIRGRHNATNALAALALAVNVGCPLGLMLHGLREYTGEPHRVEPVAIVHDVEYFDDSKGTNVGATVAALQGLGAERKLVVILGGEGKGQDFSPLADAVARNARAVVLIGRDAPLIRAAIEGAGIPMIDAGSMQQAVEIAAAQARTGDAVLMSPACASFDMFDNYEHRARVFCEAVHAMAQDAGVVI
ncbi:MAG: UDP-N-acetylmuramoyl-L-alanine--D-glutamate ligase [Comamonadaceae bacterium]|nr:MAG: UDP-N-acetylmuramoyl-L-alanine--D-glutamate ligase [Comamonadaceae bacterium]